MSPPTFLMSLLCSILTFVTLEFLYLDLYLHQSRPSSHSLFLGYSSCIMSHLETPLITGYASRITSISRASSSCNDFPCKPEPHMYAKDAIPTPETTFEFRITEWTAFTAWEAEQRSTLATTADVFGVIHTYTPTHSPIPTTMSISTPIPAAPPPPSTPQPGLSRKDITIISAVCASSGLCLLLGGLLWWRSKRRARRAAVLGGSIVAKRRRRRSKRRAAPDVRGPEAAREGEWQAEEGSRAMALGGSLPVVVRVPARR